MDNDFVDLSYLSDDELKSDFDKLKQNIEEESKILGQYLKSYALLRNKFDSYLREFTNRNIEVEI